MQERCYRIEADKRLSPAHQETALESWKRGDGSFWLDVDASGEEVLDRLLAGAGVDDAVRQVCLEAQDIPRVIPGERAVFFQFPIPAGPNGTSPVYLSVLCLPRLVITFHKAPIESLAELADRLQSTPVGILTATSGLVCILLMTISSRNLRQELLARRRVDELTAKMDSDPGTVRLDQILAEKAVALALDAIFSETSQIVPVLRFSRSATLDMAALEPHYQIVSSNSEYLARSMDRHWLRLSELHQRYALKVQENANHRLTFLTVASAIFLPLTLLTGIYGMNFQNMPELRLHYAYPAFLLVLVSIACGLWFYFRRKGWFE
jgi:magnesium transporter